VETLARKGLKLTEKVLAYPRGPQGDYDGIVQRKPWDCAAAAAQAIAAAAGVYKSEDWIIDRVNSYVDASDRIDEDGTNHAGLMCPLLDELMPGSGYTEVWLSREPLSSAQVEALWANATRSIDAGRGVLVNFEAPPGRGPRGTRGSVSPPYPPLYTTFHYVSALGYAVDPDGSRHLWIADSASFGGITGYWCALGPGPGTVSSLIVPHAYAYAATAPAVPVSTPAPAPGPVRTDSDRTDLEWLAFIGDQSALAAVLTLARNGDTRARLVLNQIEAVNPAALQQFTAAATKGRPDA
jgi:hypothetical protein